jgi:endonuclease-8
VPEGDTVAWTAHRLRPVLEGRVPEEIRTPQARHRIDRWPERLAGRAVEAVDTHGKHLLIRFAGGLTLHSHLGMTGSWLVRGEEPMSSRAWIMMRAGERWVAELGGPVLELLTDARLGLDQRLAALGPDVLAPEFDTRRFVARLRADDPARPLGDALLDQRNLAGIGNIWKSEGCWEAGIDPWRPLRGASSDEAAGIVQALRPRMLRSATEGPRTIQPRVYGKGGQPCPRCGERIVSRGQGDANRTTYWCPGCQR